MRDRATLLLAFLLLLTACDLQGSPKQEAKELVDAVQDGDSPGTIAEEAGEVVGAAGREAGDAVQKAIEDAKKKKAAQDE